MINYKYTARDLSGKLQKGKISVQSAEEFYAKMQEKQLYCISADEFNDSALAKGNYHMKMKDISIFCRQLSTMLSAGVTLIKAIDILYNKTVEKKQKLVFLALYEDIQKGLSLYEAMLEQKHTFPMLLINMIQAGETSGTIDVVMLKMADYYESQYKLLTKIKTSMAYPVLLTAITFLVVILLFVFVLPNFFVMFENSSDIPAITKVIMAISDFLIYKWYVVVLGILLLILAGSMIFRLEKVQYSWDWLKLNFPAVSKLTKTVSVSFFTNSMAILYSSGISMLDAIEISVEILDNKWLKRKFVNVIENVGKGEMMSASIDKENIFDPMVTSMIYVGEESGQLDTVLNKLSIYYSNESEQAIAKLTALFEPLMMVVIGIIIGVIVAAVMLPMYSMYQGVL